MEGGQAQRCDSRAQAQCLPCDTGLAPAQVPLVAGIPHRAPGRAVTHFPFPDRSFPSGMGLWLLAWGPAHPWVSLGWHCSDPWPAQPRRCSSDALSSGVAASPGHPWRDSAQSRGFRSCHQLAAPNEHRGGMALVMPSAG